jgi:lipoprotein-anchoring transpeptidase ErfK/SrfK
MLHAYVASLSRHWTRKSNQADVKLVGTHAVITPKQSGIAVDTARMNAEIEGQLTTGKRTLLQLAVKKTRVSAVTQAKAVVVRLGSQRLTAYLNGKPILTTPVTTGRPALPTPIGSYNVQFRASPYVFHSPWPEGSPYYYPPTPVTWAMEFYDGDFLHDDPAEPTDAFGSDSQNGYFASHGCVHVPHSVMAWLYNWLPVGAPVIVAQN